MAAERLRLRSVERVHWRPGAVGWQEYQDSAYGLWQTLLEQSSEQLRVDWSVTGSGQLIPHGAQQRRRFLVAELLTRQQGLQSVGTRLRQAQMQRGAEHGEGPGCPYHVLYLRGDAGWQVGDEQLVPGFVGVHAPDVERALDLQ